MPSFGKRSTERLSTAHPLLQLLFRVVVEEYDCAVLEGHRTRADQRKALKAGTTTLPWPGSKHNVKPSKAVDVAPWVDNRVPWEDHRQFYQFSGYVQGVADRLGIKIRRGADWDSDNDVSDQKFNDLPHYELSGNLLTDI